jgi:peptidoglycan/xylan/chitin deacetylase (PgdA/CDA1 family)
MVNILLFHNITRNPSSDFYSVTGDFFKELLNQVKESSTGIKTLRDFYDNALRNQDKSIVLTFDDGALSDYEIIFPLLKEFNFCASFFITVNFVGKKGFMQWDMIKELKDNNMEIGSHTISHPFLSRLSANNIREELYASRCILEDKINSKIDMLSLPHGSFNRMTVDMAFKAGYRIICTSVPGINSLKRLKTGVLYRNSLNRTTKILNIFSIINPTPMKMFLDRAGFDIRRYGKRFLGIRRYQSLRNGFFKN